MSGKHWLEREPQNSPGLQRIREAQQAVALAKAQEAQRAREAGVAVREAEQKRLEMLARIEQKTAQVLPLLEEIRDFANQARTYPIGLIAIASDSEVVPDIDQEAIVEIADIENPNIPLKVERLIDLKYGYGGIFPREYGIRLKIDYESGIAQLCRQKMKVVPGQIVFKTKFVPEHKVVIDEWITFPTDSSSQKEILSEAFHNPVSFKPQIKSRPLRLDLPDFYEDSGPKGIDRYP